MERSWIEERYCRDVAASRAVFMKAMMSAIEGSKALCWNFVVMSSSDGEVQQSSAIEKSHVFSKGSHHTRSTFYTEHSPIIQRR